MVERAAQGGELLVRDESLDVRPAQPQQVLACVLLFGVLVRARRSGGVRGARIKARGGAPGGATRRSWTRAREIADNPHVALLFYWPPVERQVHVAGRAAVAERELAVELFAARDPSHQVQTLVSRQGEPIDDIEPLRARHAHLMDHMEAPPECPTDWGAIRVVPEAIEFWRQAPDRMHDRLLYERTADGWRSSRLVAVSEPLALGASRTRRLSGSRCS